VSTDSESLIINTSPLTVIGRRRPRFPAGFLIGLIAFIALFFLLIPIATLIIRALTIMDLQGVSLGSVGTAIALSITTTAASALLTILGGTPLAYVLARRRFRARQALIVIVEWPIVLPPAVAGLALLLTFGRLGLFGPLLGAIGVALPFSTAAVIIAQLFVSAPFYVRSALVGFQNVPRAIEDAARVDGAAGWTLFSTITLPLSLRSLLSGLTLSWMRALGEFGATILFAGNLSGQTQTMPLLVYTLFEQDLDAAILAGVILAGIALLALIGSHWLTRSLDIDSDPLAGII